MAAGAIVMSDIEIVKVSSLDMDLSIYPRERVDQANVKRLIETLANGFSVTPVIADRRTRKVTDGFHRCTASLQHFGPDAEIAVEWRDYYDLAAMFQDAVSLNVAHGKARCLIIAQQLGIDKLKMAACMRKTQKHLDALYRKNVALGPSGPQLVGVALRDIADRQFKAAKAGEPVRPLLPKQMKVANAKVNWRFLLNQTLKQVRAGVIPADNASAVKQMRELGAEIASWLAGR